MNYLKLFFDENIAKNLYKYNEDMDAQNYCDSREKEIELLQSALEKVYSYASYNNDFLALYNALYMAFSED